MIRGVTDTNERPQVMNNRSATVMLGLEGMAVVFYAEPMRLGGEPHRTRGRLHRIQRRAARFPGRIAQPDSAPAPSLTSTPSP